jgi:hypothetical protein
VIIVSDGESSYAKEQRAGEALQGYSFHMNPSGRIVQRF